MEPALEHVDMRLDSLQSELAECEDEIRTQQAKITNIRVRIEELRLMRAMISEEKLVLDGEHPEVAESQTATGSNGRLPGPSEAVLDFVTKSGSAVRPVTIVNELENRIQTSAKDRRRTLFNTIYNMVKTNKLEKTRTGRIKRATAQ
ncbi:hypothetical protein ACFL5Q_06895 [Planctomycetota bacterium]